MNMFPVNSKTITEMGFDAEANKIYARFSSGVLYSYSECSQEDYDAIVNAESVGSMLRKVTKGKPFIKVVE